MKPSEINDFYARLGVRRDASQEEIDRQYRRLVLKYHPDLNKNKEDAAREMTAINEAYTTLSDPKKRREYDSTLPERETIKDSHEPFNQHFEQIIVSPNGVVIKEEHIIFNSSQEKSTVGFYDGKPFQQKLFYQRVETRVVFNATKDHLKYNAREEKEKSSEETPDEKGGLEKIINEF